MDFIKPTYRKKGRADRPNQQNNVVYPLFKVGGRIKDLMVQGKQFYAVWDEQNNIWSTNIFDAQRLIDDELSEYAKTLGNDLETSVLYLNNYSTGSWEQFLKYMKSLDNSYKELDSKVTFQDQPIKRSDYVSKRLPYSLNENGSTEAYDELMSVLYSDEQRDKLEWAVGSIVAGDSRHIQKFIVLYGGPGSGKSTFLNILDKLFEGYTSTFEADALTSRNSSFAMDVFRDRPLVAIQHDGDLSRIEDNSRLNSITSHEKMVLNEKYKSSYTTRIDAMLFLGTNKAVKITDAKSGIMRRLIDVSPTGNKIPPRQYQKLMTQIDFELGAIAWKCLKKYEEMGKDYYNSYSPIQMMFHTDIFYNFMEENYDIFKEQDGTSLQQAYSMYKLFCEESLVQFKMPRHRFREELQSYFKDFDERAIINGERIRSYFHGLRVELFDKRGEEQKIPPKEKEVLSLVLDETESLFDKLYSGQPAQYGTDEETPRYKWENVKTTLADLNTKKLHYILLPGHHIVIDFDLKGPNGEKNLELNLEAANVWPATYAEFSKSGAGIHLHYIYDGDVEQLERLYSEGIEIKVFTGKSALRRRLSKCNNRPIAHIRDGLPLKKGGKKVVNEQVVKSEQKLRDLIRRNIAKEFHPGTKPSVDFIKKILDDAYSSGLKYDVSDLYQAVLNFAASSTNQSEYCVKLMDEIKFKSEEVLDVPHKEDMPIVFFDVEVFPNLLVVVYKQEGENNKPIALINPLPELIEGLLKMKLVGFNNRRYDNHILYGRFIGYNNAQIYKLSQRLISNTPNVAFREAYNLSYTDIYDFSSKKQSLKKWEIALGIHHQELGFRWDEDVPEEQWAKVVEYCTNDVMATEATFNACKQDYVARLMLSKLSGLTPNNTTQQHTAKIIFGNDPKPQSKFVYTDLSELFPGYTFNPARKPMSLYLGEDPSEGGRVWAKPGMYFDVAVLDIESMHPTSAILMNIFGPYTKNYEDILKARLAIKHGDYDSAKKMLNGILAPYLENKEESTALAYALKIVINIVYGLTSAKFENKFNDPRNKDNIVAKRGALFMIALQKEIERKGWELVHVKTDSVKIANATPEQIKFVQDFGKKYGYNFKHEATYERMCLVNDAVYISKYSWSEDSRDIGKWTAVGAQFKHDYVFKYLFSGEEIEFNDLCETKEVKSALYLDFNEKLPEGEHNYIFIGKVGSFCPMVEGIGAGELMREQNDKFYAATGTKGYRWMESEIVSKSEVLRENINMLYFDKLVDEAIKTIGEHGDLEIFLGDTKNWMALKGVNINVR